MSKNRIENFYYLLCVLHTSSKMIPFFWATPASVLHHINLILACPSWALPYALTNTIQLRYVSAYVQTNRQSVYDVRNQNVQGEVEIYKSFLTIAE